ncbi:unnamed protein product [Coffea canephora]|uniref:Uncharacterized protein n=1 Tax=Coffea canephora TaxID=49390 RepID=A0A068UEJ6_COFCA|nr:unnamed protein product [Coffea canephora]
MPIRGDPSFILNTQSGQLPEGDETFLLSFTLSLKSSSDVAGAPKNWKVHNLVRNLVLILFL